MTDATRPPAKPRSSGLTRALVGIGVLFVALIVGAAALRIVVFKPFKVPSGSMVPTIGVGERVWTHALERTPVRGAIVVFPYPEHPDQLFMKRVIGLGGDTIEVKQSQVTINGWPIPRCDVGTWSFNEPVDNARHSGKLRVERLGDATYLVFDEEPGFNDYQGPYKVAAGEFFVMGDNRQNSHDSRMWNGGAGGGVKNEEALGRVHAHDVPALPRGAESLAAAFQACLAKRPAETNPPAAH